MNPYVSPPAFIGVGNNFADIQNDVFRIDGDISPHGFRATADRRRHFTVYEPDHIPGIHFDIATIGHIGLGCDRGLSAGQCVVDV